MGRIAAGELSRCVLPWVSLMKGGGESAVLDEWKRLADLEPDLQVRLQYATDALVFAELPGVWPAWKQALEGWNVRVSQQVLEWQAEARVEAELRLQRANILRLVEKRFQTTLPRDLVEALQGTEDLNTLSRWLDASAVSDNLDDFRAAVQSGR